MRHWPWQHHFVPVAVEHVIADYFHEQPSRLKEGIGSMETVVLLRCECKKVETRRMQGHWTKAQLEEAFR